MKSFIIFFLAVTIAAAIEEILENPIRIINETPAFLGQFPYQVGLDFNGKICSGALISSEWVLTAAHCLRNHSSVVVSLGGIDFYNPEIFFTVNSSKFIIHEKYNNATKWKNDIGLINVPPVNFTNNIQKIELPKINGPYPQYIDEIVIVSGWGSIDNNENINDTLRYAERKVTSQNTCKKIFIDSNVICGTPINGGSACYGRSGGPMVLKNRKILIGVASFRFKKPCEDGSPAGFTRVTSYLDWIKKNTGIEYK